MIKAYENQIYCLCMLNYTTAANEVSNLEHCDNSIFNDDCKIF